MYYYIRLPCPDVYLTPTYTLPQCLPNIRLLLIESIDRSVRESVEIQHLQRVQCYSCDIFLAQSVVPLLCVVSLPLVTFIVRFLTLVTFYCFLTL